MKITIDLTAEQIEDILKQAITAPKATGNRTASPKTPKKDGPSDKEIREWAVAEGMEVNTKGRVKSDIKLKFLAAHS